MVCKSKSVKIGFQPQKLQKNITSKNVLHQALSPMDFEIFLKVGKWSHKSFLFFFGFTVIAVDNFIKISFFFL